MVTVTKIGLLQKQKQAFGLTTAPIQYIGLDGDASAESSAQQAPAQELTTNGAGRLVATRTDVSTSSDTAIQLVVNYEFTGVNAINAIFVAWSGTAGNNMYARHKLTSVQNVGAEDTMTVTFIDHEAAA